MPRTAKKKDPITVVVSGGFDPVHVGHVRLFKAAKELGDELIIILNNDNWLRRKKKTIFMLQEERKEVLAAFEFVDRIVITRHTRASKDMSVCNELRSIRPHIFANGGDRKEDNIPELSVCEEIQCEAVFNVGAGGKVQSSSWLLKRYFVRTSKGK